MNYKTNIFFIITVVMKGKISYIDQNIFLHQAVIMFFSAVKLGILTWDWLSFAASLQWPVNELQF